VAVAEPTNGFVPVADVVKAVGLRGEVKLYPLLDFHAPLLESPFLIWQDGTAAVLERARPAGTSVAVKPAGCDDRDAAEALVGRQLGFRRGDYLNDAFPRPRAGLPFRFLGRPVQRVDGVVLGPVIEVRRYVEQVLLVVEYAGREVLIPAVWPILQADAGIDGPLVIDPPEGLLDA
jgi:ribosomal 30S subunit maturation factor RimM